MGGADRTTLAKLLGYNFAIGGNSNPVRAVGSREPGRQEHGFCTADDLPTFHHRRNKDTAIAAVPCRRAGIPSSGLQRDHKVWFLYSLINTRRLQHPDVVQMQRLPGKDITTLPEPPWTDRQDLRYHDRVLNIQIVDQNHLCEPLSVRIQL